MITVGELIKQLSELDQDLPCILQGDGEGNDYRPANGADGVSFYKHEDYQTEVLSPEDLEEYGDESYEKCVILW